MARARLNSPGIEMSKLWLTDVDLTKPITDSFGNSASVNSQGVITYTDFYGVTWSYDPNTETFSGSATGDDGTTTEEWSYDLLGNTVYTDNVAGTIWTSDPIGGELY